MRKVFLDDLPITGKSNKINWKCSVGYLVPFVYESTVGTVEIVGYQYPHILIKYQDKRYLILPSSFRGCHIGEILGKHTRKYRFEIGDIVDNVNNGKLMILGHIRMKGGNKGYKYRCLVCNNQDIISEGGIISRNNGCSVCANQKVLKGYNDVWTTRPDIAKLMLDKEYGYKYAAYSSMKIDWKCDVCGEKIKSKIISNVTRQGLSCPRCSDGVSMPEKFTFNTLGHLDTIFEFQYSPTWAIINGHKNKKINGRKYYDFYIQKLNMVIETNGLQHKNGGLGGLTADDQMENDRIKKELFFRFNPNGIYIEVEIYKTDLNYLKQQTIEALSPYFDFDNINWNEIYENSQKTLVKIACDYFNNGYGTATDISKEMRLGRTTVRGYLKRGAEIGWCNYNTEEEREKRNAALSSLGKTKEKAIVQLSLTGEYLDEFESIKKASKTFHIFNISNACKGKYGTAGGYKWMYKEDYDKMVAEQGEQEQIQSLT